MSPGRSFSGNLPVLNASPAVYEPFKDYKYRRDRAAGALLGRILVGFLIARSDELDAYDYFIPMPWHSGGGAPFDHIKPLLTYAQECLEDPRVVTDHSMLRKTRATASQAGDLQGGDARRESYQDRFDALCVPADAPGLSGARIVVIDDVFTTGTTLNAAAHRLRDAGAHEVRGVSLFRHKSLGS